MEKDGIPPSFSMAAFISASSDRYCDRAVLCLWMFIFLCSLCINKNNTIPYIVSVLKNVFCWCWPFIFWEGNQVGAYGRDSAPTCSKKYIGSAGHVSYVPDIWTGGGINAAMDRAFISEGKP